LELVKDIEEGRLVGFLSDSTITLPTAAVFVASNQQQEENYGDKGLLVFTTLPN